MDKLVSVEGLADLLGINQKVLYRWIQADRFHLKSKHLIKMSNLWRIDQAGFDALIAEMKEG